MGFYDDRVLPHLIEATCGMAALTPLRKQACAPLSGRMIEIGFGSGLNVGVYPPALTEVAAVEPSDVGWSMATDRVATSTVPIERAGLDGQKLPFDDESFDAALTTFTLCTILDASAALAELRRVLRPGGTLAFLEHGRAPDASVRRWQGRLEPIQKRVAGGCHLTRDVRAELADAGFAVGAVDAFYQPGVPKPFGALSLGTAQPA
ncbi:methyltransferase domain-containing protein [Gordonia jinghuaiqii]|uniref:Class I SAM-dependent methyltransferase n=1 Tax=Gordonia jinghuaiqii TaxID=2758710 RepID=A0A7D7LSS6_9ACTN|nr:class I SAM-dependent methyltransferase [Gordonia jinghuaiqii]MCR5977826.1 methyltransferase domain-containing protein [Gordonia jinghuaiqii]QMT02483.1 class I SAM-dependent methyltransferase [Gordonia jinghuaiqii]